MTANRGRPDVRLLAALDAGLLDEATAREVRAAADADPAARAVLDALAATRAELAALPDPPVPPALAERWSAALAAEQSRLSAPTAAAQPHPPPPALRRPTRIHRSHPIHRTRARPTPQPRRPRTRRPPHLPHTRSRQATARPHPDSAMPPSPPTSSRAPMPEPPRRPPAPGRPRHPLKPTMGGRRGSASRPPRNPVRRPGRWLRRPAVLAAALLVAVGVVAALRARPEPLPAVGRPQLVAEALSALGVRDTAGLAEPTRRAGCLRAVGAPVESPAAPLLGGRRVTFEGSEGVLLVLGTGRRGAFDVLIVDPDCGPGAGQLLAATRVTPP